MRTQPSLFEINTVPDGFLYRPEFVSPAEEERLVSDIAALPFGLVVMRGVEARRRVVQFGSNYRLDRSPLPNGGDLPACLFLLRDRAADFAGVRPEALSEALVTEYPPGAPIGWHRDAPPFGLIVGVSLLAPCQFKLREMDVTAPRTVSIELAPRSAYVMRGAARSAWQHSIPAVKSLRYSVTFRTLRRAPSTAARQA
jgi:alkylated DNA repair dioxygenase AlkB